MKCYNHKAKDAEAFCSVCNKPLCDLCVETFDDGSTMCSGCAILSTLNNMRQRVDERLAVKEDKKEQKKIRKKQRVKTRNLVLISIAFVIAAAELLYYFKFSKSDVQEFVPLSDRPTMTIIINQAIQDYRRDNEGILLFSLEDLLGKYLPSDKFSLEDLENFTYNRITPTMYEFMPKEVYEATATFPEFLFTEEGIEFRR